MLPLCSRRLSADFDSFLVLHSSPYQTHLSTIAVTAAVPVTLTTRAAFGAIQRLTTIIYSH